MKRIHKKSSYRKVIGYLGLFCAFAITFSLLSSSLLNESNPQVLSDSTTLPAFPGAQGFGSKTYGGRGGKVIEVTNLNDTGLGSFRQAVEIESGARIVVFRIGGLITAKSEIKIVNPFLTIAGQTAPGSGIAIAGSRLSIQTHDVIVRGLKMRIGDGPGQDPDNRDAIGISGFSDKEAYNIVIDHNSLSWAIDETASTWDNSSTKNKVHHITFSNNIISESLNCNIHKSDSGTGTECRGMGFLVGDYTKNISIHNNLLATNNARNPLFCSGTSSEFVNNVVYNYGLLPTDIANCNNVNQPIFLNIMGNYYKPTAGTVLRQSDKRGIYVRCIPSGSKIFVKGNIGPGRLTDNADEWSAVTFQEGCSSSAVMSGTNALPQTSGLTSIPAVVAYSHVLANAGARYPVLDSVDTRVINNTKSGVSPISTQIINYTGTRNAWQLDTPREVGIVPIYKITNSSIVDLDHDGMPDTWEKERGGDLNPSSSAPSGYTWIEEYINALIVGSISTTPKLPTSTAVNTPLVAPTGYHVVRIPAFMDAYVDADHPDTIYNETELHSRIGPHEKIIYIKFVPTSITKVTKAMLRIKVTNPSINSHTVYATRDDWSEDTLTYKTRKALAEAIVSFKADSTGWKEIDVTKYVNSKKGLARLSIAIHTTKYDDMKFASSETRDAPELIVTY